MNGPEDSDRDMLPEYDFSAGIRGKYARRYPEGANVDAAAAFPTTRLTTDPQVCGGQPCVRGLSIPVSMVLLHLASGKTPEQIVVELPELELEDVLECLRYAAWLAAGRVLTLPAA